MSYVLWCLLGVPIFFVTCRFWAELLRAGFRYAMTFGRRVRAALAEQEE